MFSKILVANRGEIAIRAFRAAYELGAQTVAVFPYEDRNSVHRLKADEAYQIGERGHPVRAYLDVDEIVRAALRGRRRRGLPRLRLPVREPGPRRGLRRRRHHLRRAARRRARAGRQQGPRDRGRPGGRRARRCASSPPVDGRRRARRAAARAARLPACSSRRSPAAAAAACAGSTTPAGLREALETAHARGRGRVRRPDRVPRAGGGRARGTSRCRSSPTAPATSIHLFERDCSVQRRHQKVVEIAPAPNLDPDLRDADLRRRGAPSPREIGYVNAGTVEFLLDPRRAGYVFIEMNPRIQVEHTVTEEITDVDLVQAQIRIAAGETLADLGLAQDDDPDPRRRAAVPDHHRGPGQRLPPRHRRHHHLPLAGRRGRPARRRHRVHRRRGQRALRLDAGQAHLPRPRRSQAAVDRARRALAEFRIRGVATNIPFLQAVLDDPDFLAGRRHHVVHRGRTRSCSPPARRPTAAPSC